MRSKARNWKCLARWKANCPPPPKKRPFAAGFLAVMVLVSVFGIGGVQLKSRYRNVAEIYTSEVDKHGNSIQGVLPP